MSKHKQHIDDFFKKHLGKAEIPLDGGEWEAIFQELHTPKKKRLVWWTLLVPLIFLGALFSLLLYNSTSSKMEPVKLLEKSTKRIKSANNQFQKSKKYEIDSMDFNNVEMSTTGFTTKSEPTSVVLIPKLEEDGMNGIVSDKASTTHQDKTPEESIIPTMIFENETRSIKLITNKLDQIIISSLYDFDYPIKVPILDFKCIDGNLLPKISPIVLNRATWQIGVITNFSNNQQVITANPSATQYKQYRDINESHRITPSFGLVAKTSLKDLLVESGISYLQRGQKLKTRDGDYVLTYQIYDSIPYLNPAGDTIRFLPYNYRDTSISTNFNQPTYHYIGIPISFGYTFTLTPKWGIETTLRSDLGYMIAAKGSVITDANHTASNGASEYNRFLITGGARVGVNYAVNQNWIIQLNTLYTQDFSNMLKHQDASQKSTLLGGGLSLYCKLKK